MFLSRMSKGACIYDIKNKKIKKKKREYIIYVPRMFYANLMQKKCNSMVWYMKSAFILDLNYCGLFYFNLVVSQGCKTICFLIGTILGFLWANKRSNLPAYALAFHSCLYRHSAIWLKIILLGDSIIRSDFFFFGCFVVLKKCGRKKVLI